MTHKHKHHKHKVVHNVIKPALVKGPKVKIKSDGKLKRISFSVARPSWGKKIQEDIQ
jgi:hypothetical protein